MDPAGLAGWKSQGFIPTADQFIEGTPAEVRTYTSPEGMCYALPRYTDSTKSTVMLDGVICLGKQSSKVCFWDNQWTDPATGTRTQFEFPAGSQIPIGVPSVTGGKYQAGGTEIANPNLGGICTDCHAGENPFITHPKSNLAESGPKVLWESLSQSPQSLPTMPVNRYDPIVAADWPQNQLSQAASTLTMLTCASCHVKGNAGRLPHISNKLSSYCTFIFQNAIARTMPPSDPGSQAAAGTAFMNKWCNSPPDPSSADKGEPSGLPGPLPLGAKQVAVAPLSDSRLEAWTVTRNGGLFSTWKVSTDPNADWAPWFNFLAYRGGLPAAVQQVAMAPLPDGRLEAWVVTENGGLFSTWKVSTDPNADWAPWFNFLADRAALPAAVRQVAMGRLPDGRIEAWVVTENGGLFSTWKVSTDPNADWAPWFNFLADRAALPAAVQQVAMAPLPDGRLEAWVVTENGGLFSTWKVSTDPNADWAPWFNFLADRAALPAAVQQVAMAPLPDGRLEAWVVTENGGLFSTWKVSTDPNADWAPWFNFLADRAALPAAVQQVAMAPLPDGRLEAWVVTANGGLFSTWKVTTDPNADWTAWADLLQ